MKDPQTDEGLERWKHLMHTTQALSNRFPEVELEVTESFAHDAGDIRRVESIKVAGKLLEQGQDPLEALVAARGGWGPRGESTDEAILATVEAFYRAFSAAMNTRVVYEAPTGGKLFSLNAGEVTFHPPQAQLHTLPDGSRVVTFAQLYTYDGGNHGTQLSREVHAHCLPSGARFPIPHRRDRVGAENAPEATPPLPRRL